MRVIKKSKFPRKALPINVTALSYSTMALLIVAILSLEIISNEIHKIGLNEMTGTGFSNEIAEASPSYFLGLIT